MRAHAAALAALSLAGALTLTGCGADGQNSASDTAARPPAADSKAREGAAGSAAAPAPTGSAGAAGSAGKTDGAPVTVRPNVIRTATLGIETSDVQKTLAAARGAADGAGGYVGNESTKRGENGRMTSTVTLRVPGEHYDAVLGAMEGSGKLLHRKVEAQDVTEKVADIDSRVSSQQASVARVREMMGKATALSEVVMLESELSRRQSDLESLLAQQTALKDKTSMGTITLEVSEPAPPVVEKKKEKKEPTFLSALSGGWEIFTKILRYLLAALGALLPFLATAAVVVLLVRAYRRWRPARPKTGLTPKRLPVPAARQTPPAPASAPTAAAAPAADTEDGVRD